MVELLRYLEAHDFTYYIISAAAATSCARSPAPSTKYPPERVVGRAQDLPFEGRDGRGDLLIQPALDMLDDGPEKPVRIWDRIGRRPIFSAGNTNGDDEMLMYSGGPAQPRCACWCSMMTMSASSPTPAGTERALEHAGGVRLDGRTSMKRSDSTTVFSRLESDLVP